MIMKLPHDIYMDNLTQIVLKPIHPKWDTILRSPINRNVFGEKTYVELLSETLGNIVSRNEKLVPDSPSKILRCLQEDPDNIKVVILGQDPYPEPGVATGLAFGVNNGSKVQPSLNIMLRELQLEYPEFMIDTFDTSLESWANQGVLLLNTALSCKQFTPKSHTVIWHPFMSALISILNDFKITRKEQSSLVFVFLGQEASKFKDNVSDTWHYKITRYHPVAESYGNHRFTGFYKEANQYLNNAIGQNIQWF